MKLTITDGTSSLALSTSTLIGSPESSLNRSSVTFVPALPLIIFTASFNVIPEVPVSIFFASSLIPTIKSPALTPAFSAGESGSGAITLKFLPLNPI